MPVICIELEKSQRHLDQKILKQGLNFKENVNVYSIKYEDIIQDTEKSIKNLCSFLNIPYNNSIKEYYKYSSKKRDSAWQDGLKPIYNTSVKKWEKPEHKRVIEELYNNSECITLLKELDYEI